MTKNNLISLVAIITLTTTALFAQAQQPVKVYRVGYLGMTGREQGQNRVDSFIQGMRDRGYVVGKNLVECLTLFVFYPIRP